MLAIVRALVDDTGNAQAQTDLAATLDQVGDVKHQAGDRARAAYEEGLMTLKRLQAAGQLTSDQQGLIASVQKKLVALPAATKRRSRKHALRHRRPGTD